MWCPPTWLQLTARRPTTRHHTKCHPPLLERTVRYNESDTLENRGVFFRFPRWGNDFSLLIFVCPCFVSRVFSFNQQFATVFDYLFLKGSACFGQFLRPSSGAHNCTISFRYCQPILLQAGDHDTCKASSISSTIPACSSIGWQYLKLNVQLCAPDVGRRNEPPETCREF